MEQRPERVRLWTLVKEELRALPRNGFAMGAVIVVLGVLAPLAALAYTGSKNSIRDTLIFTWLVGQLIVAIVVASRVASARRTRFVDSLYTTPLHARTWLTAQAIVGGVLAVLVLLIQVPFLLVHIAYLGMPVLLPNLLLGAVLMGAFAVSLGLFCGVIVGDSGPGAAIGLAGSLSFAMFMLFLMHGLAVSGQLAPTRTTLLRLTSLSPLTSVIDGTSISIFGALPRAMWRPFAGLAGMIVGLSGAAWIAYTKAQGPLGWETRRRSRIAVIALAAIAFVVPAATAATVFDEAGSASSAPPSPGEYTQIAFVARGAPINDETFTLSGAHHSPHLQVGHDAQLDALVLLLIPSGTVVGGVEVEIEASSGIAIMGGGRLVVSDGKSSEHARPGTGWETVSDGPPRPVYRIPVTLRAHAIEALAEYPLPVEIHTRFIADGKQLTSDSTVHLYGEIESADTQLILAGLPLPLMALGALATRKIRTR